ncbi:MAG TPA: hypothetical protein VEG60_22955 [Candidatus Binatia bacterium]|nr:hypothetical protein [Candidatus Binatia bacterium]
MLRRLTELAALHTIAAAIVCAILDATNEDQRHQMVCTLVHPVLHTRPSRTVCWLTSHRSSVSLDGKYFGSIRAPELVYDYGLDFLKRTHGRKLREVMDAEIDISDVIQ